MLSIPVGEDSVSDSLIQAFEKNTSVKVLRLNGETLGCFLLNSSAIVEMLIKFQKRLRGDSCFEGWIEVSRDDGI